MDIDTLAIILVSGFVAVMLLMSIGFTVFMVVRAFRGPGRRRNSEEAADETRMIQEIHHGMLKMEDRVEALETLLLGDDRDKRSEFDRELRKS